MNVAKFIVTVLATALYTSSIWGLCVFDLNKTGLAFPFLITLIFGSFGLVIGLAFWIFTNWDK